MNTLLPLSQPVLVTGGGGFIGWAISGALSGIRLALYYFEGRRWALTTRLSGFGRGANREHRTLRQPDYLLGD